MNAHSTCQMAEKCVALGLFTRDSDAERGIGETLLNNAGEFDNVFGHKSERRGERPRDLTDGKRLGQGPGIEKTSGEGKLYCYNINLFHNKQLDEGTAYHGSNFYILMLEKQLVVHHGRAPRSPMHTSTEELSFDEYQTAIFQDPRITSQRRVEQSLFHLLMGSIVDTALTR